MALAMMHSEPWERVLDFAECALFLADHEAHLLWCNDALPRVLGWPREQMAALDLESLLHPDDRADATRIADSSLAQMQARSFVCRVLDSQSVWRWIRWDGRPIDGQRVVGRARRLDHAPSVPDEALPPASTVESIVHDFNNLLFALTGGIELAHEQVRDPAVLVDTLTMIGRAVDQARAVNQRLLELVGKH